MSTIQIRTIIDNIDEIERGISLSRVRELDIHELCKRKKVVVDDRNSYLYFLTPLIRKYVHVKMERENNELLDDDVGINDFERPDTSSHEDNVADESSRNEQAAAVENVDDYNGRPTVIEEPHTNPSKLRHNELAENSIADLIDNVNDDVKRSSHSVSPQSSSSFIDENAPRSKLVQRIYFSFTQGECCVETLFERAVLLHRFMKRLCHDGLTAHEVVKYDLYGILADYLECNFAGNYNLKNEAVLHFEYLIYKHYKSGIRDYLDCIPDDCNELKDIVGYVKRNEESRLYVRLLINASIQQNDNKRDAKFIYMFIPLLNEKMIERNLELIMKSDEY